MTDAPQPASALHFESFPHLAPTSTKPSIEHGHPVAIPRPHCTGPFCRDRDRSHRLWYVIPQPWIVHNMGQADQHSGVDLLGFLGMVRHSELRALPRLLDGIRGRALSCALTDLLPPVGASLRHSGGGGDHDDLLVRRVHCYRGAVTAPTVLPRLCLQFAPGGHGLWGF